MGKEVRIRKEWQYSKRSHYVKTAVKATNFIDFYHYVFHSGVWHWVECPKGLNEKCLRDADSICCVA